LTTEQNAAELWSAVAAERAGEPAAPAAKPEPVPAAKQPEPAADPFESIQARLNDFQTQMAGRLRNVEGHIGNLTGSQKQMKELLEASRAVSAQSSSAPSQAQVAQAVTSPKAWEDLQRDYPEFVKGVEAYVESRSPAAQSSPALDPAALKSLEDKMREEMKGATEAVRQEIINSTLEVITPDWQNVVKTQPFHAWVSGQPDDIKALSQSDKVGDAIRMLNLYNEHRRNNPTHAITTQRKQVLANATGTPRSNAAPTIQKSWDDMSPQERWNAEKAARAKRNR